MFKQGFAKYACNGDTISCEIDGFDCYARIYRDDCSDTPDQRQDGFWPSLDPDDDGFIGEGKTQAQLTAAKRRASHVMNEWKNDNWWYVVIAVTVEKNGILLTDEFGNALWGIECNYPGSDNSYLLQIANELIDEAMNEAREALKNLCNDCEAV